jgi:hypothetical protein
VTLGGRGPGASLKEDEWLPEVVARRLRGAHLLQDLSSKYRDFQPNHEMGGDGLEPPTSSL